MSETTSTQKITKDYLLKFLKDHDLAALSTVTADNKPDAATIHYVVKDNFDIFFLTKPQTGKYQNILKNNEVVLTITNAQKLETVKIKGKAFTLEEDPRAIIEVITSLSHSQNFAGDLDKLLPIIKRDGGRIFAIKIEPYEIRLSRYSQGILDEELFYFKELVN